MQPCAIRRVRIPIETTDATFADEAPHVLLVTDDDDLRSVAERALHREGFRVTAAAHAGHALLACLIGSRVDVLIAELSMRDMSGPILAQRVRRYFPDVPTVYLAAPGTAECEKVLVRPFTRDELIGEVERALATTSAGETPAST